MGVGQPKQGCCQTDRKGEKQADPGDLKRDYQALDEGAGSQMTVLESEDVPGNTVPLPVVSEFLGSSADQPDNGQNDSQIFQDIDER